MQQRSRSATPHQEPARKTKENTKQAGRGTDTLHPNSTPPLKGASWRPSWGIRVVPVEVLDQRGGKNKETGDPRAFLWPITFPVNQELQTTPPPARSHKAVNSEGRMVIHNQGGRRGLGWRGQWTDGHGLELRDMKCGMDLHGGRQGESYSRWVDDLLNREWTNKTGR